MKKRAFTLTELLVVVVIVGVLSAVVLPKFTKILQTRKTTEAENVMAAVRNEQEARCMVGRNYTADTAKLASLPKADSKNYTYSLDAQGITATAKDGEYILQIPSYTDGRICCSEKVAGNGACDALNKDYPKCGEIPNLETATCEAPEVPENQDSVPTDCTPGQTEDVACECGQKSRTCNDDGTWGEWSECPSCPSCDENAKPTTTQKCTPTGYSTECGEQTRSVKCDASTNYAWQTTDWGTCQTTSECKNPSTCTDGEIRKVTETAGGCADVIQRCKDGEWQPHESVLKEDTECTPEEKDGDLICKACRWSCPEGKTDMGNKKCCLPGQIVKNGQCLYKYRPNRFDVNILVVCHSSAYELTMPANAIISEEDFNKGYSEYNSMYNSYAEYVAAIKKNYQGTQGYYGGPMNSAKTCSAMGYAYYRGGNIPWVNEGSGCDFHYAYYNGGKWWEGGTRVPNNPVYGSDQDWCDTNCGQKTSCSAQGIVNRGNPPSTCSSYHCSNGWQCDNAPGGTGVALECIREY